MVNANELLGRSKLEQEHWLLENQGVFYSLMMSGEHIGLLIRANERDIEDLLNNPEREEIDNFIEHYCPEITSQRAEEIRTGATVTEQEKTFLIKAAALMKSWSDTEGYVRTVCTISVGENKVYPTFTSVIAGPNEEVNLDNIYRTREEAIHAIKNLADDEYLFPI